MRRAKPRPIRNKIDLADPAQIRAWTRRQDVDRQHRDFSELRRHAKVYSFRIITAVLAWVFIEVAFYYRPDWIRWGLQTATHGIYPPRSQTEPQPGLEVVTL
jgi:hypothetical protein